MIRLIAVITILAALVALQVITFKVEAQPHPRFVRIRFDVIDPDTYVDLIKDTTTGNCWPVYVHGQNYRAVTALKLTQYNGWCNK